MSCTGRDRETEKMAGTYNLTTNGHDLVLIEVPAKSTDIYLSRTGLIWYPGEDKSHHGQSRDMAYSRDSFEHAGMIDTNGASFDFGEDITRFFINNLVPIPDGTFKYIVLLKRQMD